MHFLYSILRINHLFLHSSSHKLNDCMKDEMRVLIFTTAIILFSDAVFADSRAGGDWNSGFSQGSMDDCISFLNVYR